MEKRKLAKALVLTAALAGGTSLINVQTYGQGQTSLPKKYEWCQRTLSYMKCGYGNGSSCTGTGSTC